MNRIGDDRKASNPNAAAQLDHSENEVNQKCDFDVGDDLMVMLAMIVPVIMVMIIVLVIVGVMIIVIMVVWCHARKSSGVSYAHATTMRWMGSLLNLEHCLYIGGLNR